MYIPPFQCPLLQPLRPLYFHSRTRFFWCACVNDCTDAESRETRCRSVWLESWCIKISEHGACINWDLAGHVYVQLQHSGTRPWIMWPSNSTLEWTGTSARLSYSVFCHWLPSSLLYVILSALFPVPFFPFCLPPTTHFSSVLLSGYCLLNFFPWILFLSICHSCSLLIFILIWTSASNTAGVRSFILYVLVKTYKSSTWQRLIQKYKNSIKLLAHLKESFKAPTQKKKRIGAKQFL